MIDSPCLRRTSGAIYSGVPQNVYRFSPGGVLLANPKSDNLGYPFASFHVQLHPTHGESATTLVTDVGVVTNITVTESATHHVTIIFVYDIFEERSL